MPKKITVHPTPDLKAPLSSELIGKVIRAKRTQSQLRLEDAAALCGVAKETFMHVEHGHPNAQISTVLRICKALGISMRIVAWPADDEVSNEWQ